MIDVKKQYSDENFTIFNADCVEVLATLPPNSVDFSIFSPPYFSLFTYSASIRDLGNCKNDVEFLDHFSLVIKGLYQSIKPGRLIAVDCMNVPAMKERDGYIGLKDFAIFMSVYIDASNSFLMKAGSIIARLEFFLNNINSGIFIF